MYIHAPTTPFRQIQLNWIEFEIDLNEFRVSFVCRFCSIQNMLKSNNMSNWSNFQRFDDHKLKSVNSISDMINAENKSATKHQNNAAILFAKSFFISFTRWKFTSAYSTTWKKSCFYNRRSNEKKESTLIFAIETRDFGFTTFIFNSKTREPTRCF